MMFCALFAIPAVAFAQDGADSGDTAWITVSTILVMMMTIPG
jgi:Amt family ammonium transporter